MVLKERQDQPGAEGDESERVGGKGACASASQTFLVDIAIRFAKGANRNG
jgi:hypothetical protein